jgi:hypothetical protein
VGPLDLAFQLSEILRRLKTGLSDENEIGNFPGKPSRSKGCVVVQRKKSWGVLSGFSLIKPRRLDFFERKYLLVFIFWHTTSNHIKTVATSGQRMG